MTDEELAEKYVDTLLSKDNVEVDNFLDENLGDLKLTEKQCGTLLGIIKGVGITSFLAGLKADVHTDNSKVIAELEAQIEKMKFCENCKYNSYWGCSYKMRQSIKGIKGDELVECKNMDKWEIKENDE